MFLRRGISGNHLHVERMLDFVFICCLSQSRLDVLRALLPVEFCYVFLFNLLHLSLSLALVTTAVLMTMVTRINDRCQFFHRLPP